MGALPENGQELPGYHHATNCEVHLHEAQEEGKEEAACEADLQNHNCQHQQRRHCQGSSGQQEPRHLGWWYGQSLSPMECTCWLRGGLARGQCLPLRYWLWP